MWAGVGCPPTDHWTVPHRRFAHAKRSSSRQFPGRKVILESQQRNRSKRSLGAGDLPCTEAAAHRSSHPVAIGRSFPLDRSLKRAKGRSMPRPLCAVHAGTSVCAALSVRLSLPIWRSLSWRNGPQARRRPFVLRSPPASCYIARAPYY